MSEVVGLEQTQSQGKPKSHRVRNVTITVVIVLAAFTIAIVWYTVTYTCMGLNCGENVAGAQVTVKTIACGGTSNVTCIVTLLNIGNADTQVSSAVIVMGNNQTSGNCEALTIPAGQMIQDTCAFQVPPGSGLNYSGYIVTSNGAHVPFTGQFP